MAKKPYFIRMKETNSLVRIVANSPEQALSMSDRIDMRTQPIVSARNKDGSAILQYPSGKEVFVGSGFSSSDPDKIAEFKSKNMGEKEATTQFANQMVLSAAEEQSPLGRMTGPVMAASQSMGFGAGSYLDEVAGKFFGNDAQAAMRAISAAQRAERPMETFAAQAGVGVAEAAALAMRFPQLAKFLAGDPSKGMLTNVARGSLAAAGSGAVTGAIQASGEAEQGQRLTEGLKGGAIGAATGGAVGAGLPVVGAAGRNILDVLRKSDVPMIASALGISRGAAMVIKNAFNQGGNLQSASDAIKKAGEQGMLVDAGVAARALADAAGQSGPQPSQTIGDALEARAGAVKGDLEKTLTDTLGDAPLGPREAVNKIYDATRDQRQTAYDAAYKFPINYADRTGLAIEDVISRIDSKTLKEAFEEANADMLSAGIKNQQLKINVDAAGNIRSITEQPNVQQLDYLKRALQSLAEQNRDPSTYRLTSRGDRYARLARQLRSALGEAVIDPQTNRRLYDEAVKLGGDTISEQTAFKLGRDALKPQTEIEDVFDVVGSNPSDAQTQALRMGLSQYIKKVLKDVKSVPSDPDLEARQLDAFYRLTSSDAAREKITMILGNQAPDMLKQIDEVAQSALVRSQFRQGSQTAIRQSTQKSIEDQTQFGPASSLLQGKPFEAAQKIVSDLTGFTDEMVDSRRTAIYNDIARALTDRGTDKALKAVEIMQDALRGKVRTQEENQMLANEIAVILGSAGQKETERRAGGLLD